MPQSAQPQPATTTAAFQQAMCETLEESHAKLEHCLGQLRDEQIWWRPEPELNSIANLVLHMCGNLRQWSTVPLKGLGDDRDRQSEFDARDGWTRRSLLAHCRDSIDDAVAAISRLDDQRALTRFTIQGFEVNGIQALVHTVSHFVGHTHQAILLTRWILKDAYRFAWDPTGPRNRIPL